MKESKRNDYQKRLNIIEGQIKGIGQMIEKKRNCDDILIQISAISSSLKAVGDTLLKDELKKYVGNDKNINKVIDMTRRLN